MSKYDIKNVEGQAAGQADLSDDVFGIEPNIPVIHQVVVCQDACLRQGTHSTKNRHVSPAAAASLGARRAPVVPARAPSALPSGPAAALSLAPPRVTTPSASTRRWSSSL